MAKRKAACKSIVLRYISDPGHGWVEVPKDLLKKLRLGTDFSSRGKYCYLEEDSEATRLDRAIKKHGMSVVFADAEVYDFDSWLSGDDWPYVAARVYGDDIELVVAALDAYGMQMKKLSGDSTYTVAERAAWAKQFDDCQRLCLMFSTMRGGE